MKAIAIYNWSKGENQDILYYKVYNKVRIEEMLYDAQWSFEDGYYVISVREFRTNDKFNAELERLRESNHYIEMTW